MSSESTAQKTTSDDEEEDLMGMEKCDLVAKIKKLKATITKLSDKQKQWKKGRPFDFSRFCTRQIALKIAYIGWDYHGFACQDNTSNTIEEHLFNALTRSCLIKDRADALYSRCGRTDKGVSAYGQVISVRVRSNRKQEKIEPTDSCTDIDWREKTEDELNYVKMLNKILPDNIRVLGWAPVTETFSARFDCVGRTYKYFLPLSNLDVETMKEAASSFVGEHDFRNFCKVDVGNNVNHFMRRILSFDVERSSDSSSRPVCEFTIRGTAFLWHQIRCMVSLLVMIGAKLEEKTIIAELLDIKKFPKRPQYNMASEIPLILFDCEFPNIQWTCNEECVTHNFTTIQSTLIDFVVRSSLVGIVLTDLRIRHQDILAEQKSLVDDNEVLLWIPGCKRAHYKPMRQRHVCEGLERHLARQEEKRKKLKRKYEDRITHEEIATPLKNDNSGKVL